MQRVAPNGSVTGVDVSPAMLEAARGRIAAMAKPQIMLIAADAQTYAFPPHAADVAVSRFGVAHFEDTVTAYKNVYGALRPGGRFVFAEWTSRAAWPAQPGYSTVEPDDPQQDPRWLSRNVALPAAQPCWFRLLHKSGGRAVYEPETSKDLEYISEDECLELLERHHLGRLAIVVDGQPLIFPVNYGVCRRVVTIRTAHGTKLTYAPGSKVAFEIDEYDSLTGVGWSVLVQGVAVDATTALDDVSWTARGANPHPLAPGVKIHRLAIGPTSITGRRFTVDG